jgi:hypothetical protein
VFNGTHEKPPAEDGEFDGGLSAKSKSALNFLGSIEYCILLEFYNQIK